MLNNAPDTRTTNCRPMNHYKLGLPCSISQHGSQGSTCFQHEGNSLVISNFCMSPAGMPFRIWQALWCTNFRVSWRNFETVLCDLKCFGGHNVDVKINILLPINYTSSSIYSIPPNIIVPINSQSAQLMHLKMIYLQSLVLTLKSSTCTEWIINDPHFIIVIVKSGHTCSRHTGPCNFLLTLSFRYTVLVLQTSCSTTNYLPSQSFLIVQSDKHLAVHCTYSNTNSKPFSWSCVDSNRVTKFLLHPSGKHWLTCIQRHIHLNKRCCKISLYSISLAPCWYDLKLMLSHYHHT